MPSRPDPAPFLFGTVGAPIGTPKRPGGSAGAIAHIRSIGLGTLELGWVQSVRVSDTTCAAIREASRREDVPLSVHAPYFINLNAKSAPLARASIERLLAAARAGWKSGATDVVFHPGGYMGDDATTAFRAVRDRLREVRDILDTEGNGVRLRPETMGRIAMFGSLGECLLLAKELRGVQPCIDFAHLHARTGDGSNNTYREFRDMLRLVRRELGRAALSTLHIHLSGIAYGPRGEKHHLPFAEADLRVNELLHALADAGASGRILCESPVLESDALYLRNRWRRITGSRSAAAGNEKTARSGRNS